MEELRRISRAYLDDPRSSPLEGLVNEAYGSMDCDEDGLVRFPAFSAHMTEICRPDLAKKAFFEKLDSNGDGKLDWDDVATLGYAACSGRRICRGCDSFIEGVYFTCATCFHNNEHPYVLCLACHQNIRYHVDHEHKDFIDNFLLLELLRMEKLTRDTSNQASVSRTQASSSEVVVEVMPTQNSSSTAVVRALPVHTRPQPASVSRTQASSSEVVVEVMPTQNSSSTAVVRALPVRTRPQPFHWRDGLTIAGIGVSATSFILSQCSIM